MPDISTSTEHLADLELCKTEKPYAVILRLSDWNESIVINNLQFERHEHITVKDIHDNENEFTLDTQGFTVMRHKLVSQNSRPWTPFEVTRKRPKSF